MKKNIWPFITLFIIYATPCLAADFPQRIGPFILGHDISEFKAYMDMSTELSLRYLENVKEVEIRPISGFKSGLIAYGSCKNPGKVVRIKLKYQDESKAFFNTLRKKIEARFGKFVEYRGDPFQVVISWKKSFRDSQGNSISLIIQHNTRDEEEKMGNSIKLTLTNLMEDERHCPKDETPDQPEKPIRIPVKDHWDWFAPR